MSRFTRTPRRPKDPSSVTPPHGHVAGRGRSAVAALVAALLAVLVAGLVAAITAAPASAHDVLVSTSPKDGQSLNAPPSQVELTFDQPALAVGTTMVVVGPSGQVQRGKPALVNSTVRQALEPDLAAGMYTVTWRVTSADGHPVSGTLSFTVRSTGSPTPTAVGTGQTVPTTSASTEPAPAATSTAPTPPASSSPIATDEGGRGWLPWVAAALLAVAAAGAATATAVRIRRGAGGR